MKYILKIFRGTCEKQYFEEFELEYKDNNNIISALMEIQKNPVNIKKQKVLPVSFEASCLEEACGACSMLIDGYPRQACSALIKPLLKNKNYIVLAPLSKFHLIKDLVIDRKKMFEQLKNFKIWIEKDFSNIGIKINPAIADALYILSRCMVCGCCMESCPNYNIKNSFIFWNFFI